ncbi:MAG: hypothetical protein K0Q74_1557 [Gammaproteobacteria bacterium]|nr:hypothetical protein [Gammaproteobacteria bacterium]
MAQEIKNTEEQIVELAGDEEYRKLFKDALENYLATLKGEAIEEILDNMGDEGEAIATTLSDSVTQIPYSSDAYNPNAPVFYPGAKGPKKESVTGSYGTYEGLLAQYLKQHKKDVLKGITTEFKHPENAVDMLDEDGKPPALDTLIPNLAIQEIIQGLETKNPELLLPYLLMPTTPPPAFYPLLPKGHELRGKTIGGDNHPAGQDPYSALTNRTLLDFKNTFMAGPFSKMLIEAQRKQLKFLLQNRAEQRKIDRQAIESLTENFRQKFLAREYFAANQLVIEIWTKFGDSILDLSIQVPEDAEFLAFIVPSLIDLGASDKAGLISKKLVEHAKQTEDKTAQYKHLATCLRALRYDAGRENIQKLETAAKYAAEQLNVLNGLDKLTAGDFAELDQKKPLLPQLNEKGILALAPEILSELSSFSTPVATDLCTALDHAYYVQKTLTKALSKTIKKIENPEKKTELQAQLTIETLKLKFLSERYEEVTNHIFSRLSLRDEKDDTAPETPDIDRCAAYYLRARTYQAIKKKEKSLEDIRKAIALMPNELNKTHPEFYTELLIQYASVSHEQVEDMMGADEGFGVATLDQLEDILHQLRQEMVEHGQVQDATKAKILKNTCKVTTQEQCGELLKNIQLCKHLFLDGSNRLGVLLADLRRNSSHFDTVRRVKDQFVKLRAKSGDFKTACGAAKETAESNAVANGIPTGYMNAARAAWCQSQIETEPHKKRTWQKSAEDFFSQVMILHAIKPTISKEFANLVQLTSTILKEEGEIALNESSQIAVLKRYLVEQQVPETLPIWVDSLQSENFICFSNLNEYALLKIARWAIDRMRITTDPNEFRACTQILGALQKEISNEDRLLFPRGNIIEILAVQDPESGLKEAEGYFSGLTGNIAVDGSLIAVFHNLFKLSSISSPWEDLSEMFEKLEAYECIEKLFRFLKNGQLEAYLRIIIWRLELTYLETALKGIQHNDSLTLGQQQTVSDVLAFMQTVSQNMLHEFQGKRQAKSTLLEATTTGLYGSDKEETKHNEPTTLSMLDGEGESKEDNPQQQGQTGRALNYQPGFYQRDVHNHYAETAKWAIPGYSGNPQVLVGFLYELLDFPGFPYGFQAMTNQTPGFPTLNNFKTGLRVLATQHLPEHQELLEDVLAKVNGISPSYHKVARWAEPQYQGDPKSLVPLLDQLSKFKKLSKDLEKMKESKQDYPTLENFEAGLKALAKLLPEQQGIIGDLLAKVEAVRQSQNNCVMS